MYVYVYVYVYNMCVYQITGLAFACGGVINRMGCIYTKKAGMDG